MRIKDNVLTFTGTLIRQFPPIHWSLGNDAGDATDILNLILYPNRCCCKAWVMHRSFVFTTVVFYFSLLSTWKSIFDCSRHFTEFVGKKIKGEDRKEDVATHEDEIKQIWEVSVLVDLPNVHPRFICMKCRVKCSSKDYLAGKFKSKEQFQRQHSDLQIIRVLIAILK